MPAIRPLGVGMNASNDDLLTIAQELDLLRLRIGRGIGRDQVDRDFCERLVGAERYGALRRLANTYQNVTGFLAVLARQVFARLHRRLTANVEVERRNVA